MFRRKKDDPVKDSRQRLGAEALEMVATRFRMLGEPMRLRILQELQRGEMSVTHLTEAVESTQPNVSKHLKILQDGGMVARRAEGNCAFYSIADDSVFELCGVVCNGLRAKIEAQARVLDATGL